MVEEGEEEEEEGEEGKSRRKSRGGGGRGGCELVKRIIQVSSSSQPTALPWSESSEAEGVLVHFFLQQHFSQVDFKNGFPLR